MKRLFKSETIYERILLRPCFVLGQWAADWIVYLATARWFLSTRADSIRLAGGAQISANVREARQGNLVPDELHLVESTQSNVKQVKNQT